MPGHESADPLALAMGRSIFEVRGRTFTLREILCAAEFGGWIGGFWPDLQGALASAAYAADEGFEIDTEELQSAADAFRYRRGLVTAEETERWLSERDVDEDELVEYLERSIWHERFLPQLASLCISYPPDRETVAAALWPELVFSDRLGLLAVPLARRVAARAADTDAEAVGSAARDAGTAEAAFFERAGLGPEGLESWLSRTGCTAEWFRELPGLETSYRRACERALSPERCAALLDARRLDLMRLRIKMGRFASAQAAREACLCITEDGEEYGKAVARAGVSSDEQQMFLEDAPEHVRTRLLSAAPGSVVLVDEQGVDPAVLLVVEKILPQVGDPQVRARLEPLLISQYFDPLVEENVRWATVREHADG